MAAKNVEYDVIAHEPPSSSVQTAKACCIPGDWLAKAVLLRPTTKREADVVAFKLFCLFSFILVGEFGRLTGLVRTSTPQEVRLASVPALTITSAVPLDDMTNTFASNPYTYDASGAPWQWFDATGTNTLMLTTTFFDPAWLRLKRTTFST